MCCCVLCAVWCRALNCSCAAAQAVACAKLGRKGEQGQVSIITKVGTDIFGTNTIDNFSSVGLDTSCVRKYAPS